MPNWRRFPYFSPAKMSKKPSIFKLLGEYFGTHPQAIAGWFWVSFTPFLGSLLLISQYFWLEQITLASIWDHLILSLFLALILGLALLPTTLTSLACGFFLGWIGFPDLVLGYILANCLGYWLGSKLNSDFMPLLYRKNSSLEKEIESRLKQSASLIFFVRISPVIPFAISNFLFASLGVPLKKVLLFGIPGMLPRTLIAFITGMIANSFLGAREAINHPMQWVILIVLLLLSTGGIYWSWKKNKS
ncbi:putative membrane protein YdjX (TVP38/TMEM64 family) [Algoriphagus boseongensis]|uniref:Putative membrane protein YdjX (TVP38/TMEM64 family) n=2 Tax=Algoriphagus boseongensis TaxID=1442587 RepID=A0A4R6T375_9BACT|nr:putative membrane protein YdjX (TVP38/TMEM64 family) [Algoriphagus boseongensis]